MIRQTLLLTLLAVPVYGVTYSDFDFEADTVGAHPTGPFSFSPSAPTGNNGSVIIDASSSPSNPLGGQSLLVYDRSGDTGTHIRWDFAGDGVNVANARVDLNFQRAFASTDGDNDTGVKLAITMAGADGTSGARRPFEIRLLNDGTIRVNDASGTADVGDGFDVDNPNAFVILANGANDDSLSYDYDDIGAGTVGPNSMQLFLNGTSLGSFGFILNPSDDFDFSAQDEDLGRFGIYQDSGRQGEFVFDDILIESIEEADVSVGEDVLLYSTDFEDSTAGEQPSGNFTFSPSSNTTENGSVVVDASSTEADPIEGKSLYVYDGGSSPTHLRWDFAGGANVSAIRAEFDFLRGFSVAAEDNDTGIKVALARAGSNTNNSDFRPFEIRLMNDGRLRVEDKNDTLSLTPDFDPDVANTIVVLANSHDTESVSYDYEDTGAGTMAPNTMHLFLNGSSLGIFEFHQTPDPTNAPEIDFLASDTDFGRMGLYQDSGRQGGFAFDNIAIYELEVAGGGGGEVQDLFYESDFEDQTAGAQLDEPFSFSPSSNTDGNGVMIIDGTTDPVNPLDSGKSMYVYDFVGDGSSGESTHLRWDFAGGQNVSDLHVEFDFQRMFTAAEIIGSEAGLVEDDIRVHFGVAHAGNQTNNSDFRPFEIRFLNDGTIHVEAGDQPGDETAATYDTANANHVDVLMNSHDTLSVSYDHDAIGSGTLAPNSMRLFLDGEEVGTYAFHQTPDPTNAPQIDFYAGNNDLGRVGFYQDSKRQGAIVFDNLRIARLADVTGTPPAAPSELTATVDSSSEITLSWTDNSDDEAGFIIERKSGEGGFEEVASVLTDVASYTDTGLEPATEYTYRVSATNGALSDPTAEVSATTSAQLQPVIETASDSQEFVVGSTVTLSVTASGAEPLSYQWYEGDSGVTTSPISGATDSSYTTPVLSAAASYWVRVSNTNGSDDSDTIVLTPYEPATVTVSSESEFNTAMAAAKPGDAIQIASGEYADWVIEVEGEGSEGAPITVGAEVPGEVILTGASRLEISGRYLVVQNLAFVGAYSGSDDEVIQFRGDNGPAENCRLTNVGMYRYIPEDGARTFWVSLYGKNNRVDHSYFEGHDVNGVTVVAWLDGEPNDHRIDHNHFHDRIDGGENGWETIRIGTSDYSLSTSRTVVEYNLFTYVDGEIEIISNKSGGNIYRGNTFFASQGMLTLRHGHECIVDGNFFIGDGRDRTGGVRIIGEDHRVTNNYFEGTTGRDGAAITISGGVPNAALNEYDAAHNALIAFNTFVDVEGPHILYGAGYGTGADDRSILPTGVEIAHNVFAAGTQTSGTFIVGEQPANATYTGNLAFGRDLGVADTGWTIADPQLSLDADAGFQRPAATSPVVNVLSAAAFDVTTDIDGQDRDANPDLGADEVSDGPTRELVGVLTEDLVGTDWTLAGPGGDWIAGAELVATNTYVSEWFGVFWTTHWPWVYHAEHGYIYAHETGDSGVLYYDLDLGWVYTTSTIYPWIYRYSESDWLYYYLGSTQPRWFFSDNGQAWISID